MTMWVVTVAGPILVLIGSWSLGPIRALALTAAYGMLIPWLRSLELRQQDDDAREAAMERRMSAVADRHVTCRCPPGPNHEPVCPRYEKSKTVPVED